MEKNISDYLLGIGCCNKCILLFLGKSKLEFFEDPKTVSDDIQENGNSNEICGNSEKRQKNGTCICCLGILQKCTSRETIERLSSSIGEQNYDASNFSIGMSLPVSMELRIHRIWANLLKEFPTFQVEFSRRNHIGVLKDILKHMIGKKIAENINKSYISDQSSVLSVTLHARYSQDEEDCRLLDVLDEAKFAQRRKQCRKFSEGVYTKQAVEDTLKKFTDQEILDRLPGLPSTPSLPACFEVKCCHASVFMAGRYNKYSRELPQTPWLVSGDRRFESSVEELIATPLIKFIKADSIKFSASGREDVDVRCLGNGRPFVMEFLNPRKTLVTSSQCLHLQREVNSVATGLVAIRDLQVVSKKHSGNLKEGEAEKTKSYCALCFTREESPDKDLKDLLKVFDGISEITLLQTTPIRVLHRRTLSVRKRVVHSIKAETVNERFFKLYMNTQAGTYIKEFVHGDFGRTTPNVKQLLGLECDIIALDVEKVDLDWPPPIEEITE